MKNRMIRQGLFFLVAAGLCAGIPEGFCAEEFHCEVLSLKGSASATDVHGKTRELKEGDLIGKNEIVEAAEDSAVDLAFDREWKNVARVEQKSRIRIATIDPAQLDLDRGGVFAKLKALPKGSSFEVKTPTAVATVRGTEYRTTFIEGHTEIFNVSASKVFVYGVRADGSVDRQQPVVLEQSKKTQVTKAGAPPEAPQDLSADEQKMTDILKTEIQIKIQEIQTSGRISNIQSVSDMEAMAAHLVEPNDSDESRVVDLRRRPFKKAESAAPSPDDSK